MEREELIQLLGSLNKGEMDELLKDDPSDPTRQSPGWRRSLVTIPRLAVSTGTYWYQFPWSELVSVMADPAYQTLHLAVSGLGMFVIRSSVSMEDLFRHLQIERVMAIFPDGIKITLRTDEGIHSDNSKNE